MESLGVLAVGVAIVWLVVWTIKNERVGRIGEQKGLFRMRDWSADEEQAVRRGRGQDA